MKNNKPRFIRVRGRIVPVGVKKELKTASEIASRKNRKDLAKVGVGISAGLGGSYAAGALQRKVRKLKRVKLFKAASKVNFAAKLIKFGAPAVGGMVAITALTAIDKRTNDERARILSLNDKAKKGAGIALTLASGFTAYRFGKMFQYAGKKAINPFRPKNFSKLKSIPDV